MNPDTPTSLLKFMLLSFAFCESSLLLATDEWAQLKSDIAINSAATFGQFENGLQYVIVPNSNPSGLVSLRAASLNQT